MLSDKPDYEIQSTVTGHRVEMSIDMDSLGDLFDVLSGLYTDAEMAVLRELSTNARDSHIEAGVDRPIEVTLPAEWGEADLVIEDFGLGMSREDIERTYSKYGASTKRDTNALNGTLGLGSKSPLTYTPSFTFIGVKDGIKTTVSVSKGEGVPTMTLLNESETDQANGVKVIIPARAYNKFGNKAAKLFRLGWPEGSVLVNDAAPARLEPKLKLTESLWVSSEIACDYIVMAGVAYPLPDEGVLSIQHGMVRGHHLIAFVETGEVSFAPSREALKDTNKSVQKVAAILAEFERSLVTAIEADLASAALPREAFAKLHDWREALGVKAVEKLDFKYKGSLIPTTFEPKGENERVTVSERHSHKLSAATRYPAVAMEVVINSLVVHGYDAAGFTPSHKKKLNKYVEDNGIAGVEHYVLVKEKMAQRWLDPARVVDFETIRKIKLPINRSYNSGGGNSSDPDRIKGSYDLYEMGDWNVGVPAEDISTDAPIYYTTISKGDDKSGEMSRALQRSKRGYTLVVLTSNRVVKFKRLFPQAQDARVELRKIAKRLVKNITGKERLAAAVQDSTFLSRALKEMDLDRVDDPAFAEMKVLVDMNLSKTNLRKFEALRYLYLGVHDEGTKPEYKNPFSPYPLVDANDFCYNRGETEVEHRYIYLNAAYAARLADEKKEQ